MICVANHATKIPTSYFLRKHRCSGSTHYADLLPEAAGCASCGHVYIDPKTVADSERRYSAEWMLALYLHEIAHASLQREGYDASHSGEFAKRAWALARRHGVAEYVDRVYDMHETPRLESFDRTKARWQAADSGAERLAVSANPLAQACADLYWLRADLYSNIFFLVFAVFIGFVAWAACAAGLLPDFSAMVSAGWRFFAESRAAQFGAGLAALAVAVFFSTR